METGEMVGVAEALARRAHEGQVDKAGAPHIGHPARVAARAATIAPEELRADVVAAAWLHDVLEDTDLEAEDLAAAGIPLRVIEAVLAVTKRPGQEAEAYFVGIREQPVALLVKTADLIDNTDPARIRKLDDQTAARLGVKYARSWRLLLGVEGGDV